MKIIIIIIIIIIVIILIIKDLSKHTLTRLSTEEGSRVSRVACTISNQCSAGVSTVRTLVRIGDLIFTHTKTLLLQAFSSLNLMVQLSSSYVM